MNLCFAMAEIIYSMSCRVYIILRSHFEYKISIRSTRVKKYKKTSSQRRENLPKSDLLDRFKSSQWTRPRFNMA